MRKILALLFVLISIFSAMHFAVAKENITLVSPANGEKVGAELIVSGTAHNASEVWVIVHPAETPDYWVQPTATVKGDVWDVQISIGRSGTLDSGKHFEIMAIADPRQQLAPSQVMKAWPSARWKSQIISVTRK
ncbi:MAG: hypothetical protein WCH30_04775 [Chlorobiaceae bacterium]